MSQMNRDTVENVPDDPDVMQPVPVKLDPVQVGAPEFGAWATYKLLGNEAAQRILPMAPKRSEAQIQVGPGFDDNNTLGSVLVGSRAQVQNGQGGVLASGYKFTYHAQAELWLVGDGTHHLTITVLDQRYR